MSGEALRVEQLEKYFPAALSGWRAWVNPFAPATVPALRGISLTAAAGETVALVGANGAGKSTLLRILTTLLLPTRGRAWIAGVDVLAEPSRSRRQLGFYSGSDGSFYARLSGEENLLLFASLNNLSRPDALRRIAQLRDVLGLGEFLKRQVRTLSTGTVHRLGLARALLHQPAVLVLDEPTRSLDPIAAAEFRRFLHDEIVQRQGTTLVFASHSLAEVERLGARIALLDAGRMLIFDTADRIRAAAGAAATLEEAIETLVRRAGPPGSTS